MQIYKLQELCLIEISDGTHQTPTYAETGYIFLSSKNVTTGKIDWDNVMYIPESLHNELYKRIKPQRDDILLAKNGTTGIAALVDRDEVFDIYVSLALIRPDKEKVLPRYLLYAINSTPSKEFFNSNLKGIGVPNLHLKHIRETPIRVTSFEKQKCIVKTLDAVTALIDMHKRQLELLDELVKSRFVELFGELASPECKWQKEKLVDICADPDDIKCGPFGTQLSKDEYQSEGVAVWEIPQINSRFSTIPTHYLSENKAKQLEAYSIKAGDIAMSRKGNVGKCAVFPSDFEAGIIHSDVLRIRVDSRRVLPVFMLHQLHYSGAVHHQIELVSSGAIMAGINVTKLKQILVHIPPLSLQTQFATFVDQTDKSKLALHQSLEKLETLKKSLMQEYFG